MDREKYLEDMKSQCFGIELEMTGITRTEAKRVLSDLFLDVDLIDNEGRQWDIKRDSSIVAKAMINGVLYSADEKFQVELVSPILEYKDISMIQKVVRALRKAGAIDSETTGLHVHINDSGQDQDTLRNLIKIMSSREYLLIKVLEIPRDRLFDYCDTVDRKLVNIVDKKRFKDMADLEAAWDVTSNRYRMLNYSSLFEKKGIEIRCFNSCVKDCRKLRAYIIFSLAICQSAKVLSRACSSKPNEGNERYNFRNFLNRIGLVGDEFKEVRKIFLKNLHGDSSFACPEEHGRKRYMKD